MIRDIILNKKKTKNTLCWLRAEGPESTNKMCEMTGMQPGVWGAEPPDKLENSAGGARRATRDECRRHVRKLVYSIFRDYIGIFLHVYLDDIFVFSDTVQEHQGHLEKVFT